MSSDTSFWHAICELITAHSITVDRPRGSPHPRYPSLLYPYDYGYLEHTISGDGRGIDVWIGSLSTVGSQEATKALTGILCTFDPLKRDAEIKLLMDCSTDDVRVIRDFHQDLPSLYIPNPVVDHDFSN